MNNSLQVHYSPFPVHQQINNYEDALKIFRIIIKPEHYAQQNIFVLFLNSTGGLLAWRHLNMGTADATLIDLRQLLAITAGINANTICLAHTVLHLPESANNTVLDFIKELLPLSSVMNIQIMDYVYLSPNEDYSLVQGEEFNTGLKGYTILEG